MSMTLVPERTASPADVVACPACRLPLAAPLAAALPARHVTSQHLLDGSRELVIQHKGSEYHLRLTRNDKLILTK